MAAGIPAPTLPGQAAFAPAKPGVFVALVHKTRLPSCRRQGPVPPRGQHLSSVSAHKRYNTLHFACKVVCHETAGFFGFFLLYRGGAPGEKLYDIQHEQFKDDQTAETRRCLGGLFNLLFKVSEQIRLKELFYCYAKSITQFLYC